METKYIAFDFETGGLDPAKNPILTGYFAALDRNLNVIGDLELKIKPEEPFTLLEKGAMEVNGINIEEHLADPKTLSRADAGAKLLAFLKEFKGKQKTKPRPLGHNVVFDIEFTRQLIPQAEWEANVHYGVICTSIMTNVLKEVGMLPESLGNLGSLVKYFGVQERKAHTAKDDVLMMIDVYAKMIQMLKANTEGSGLSVDVLSMLEK
jgi:DNA polymerase III alpha subunit (gram-positive type)